jgi:hypothetical protein
MTIQQSGVPYFVIHPCPSCDGKGCGWCHAEPLLLPARDGKALCLHEDNGRDYDGSYIGFPCANRAVVAVTLALQDEFLKDQVHIDTVYFCQAHVGLTIAEAYHLGGTCLNIETNIDGFDAVGEVFVAPDL